MTNPNTLSALDPAAVAAEAMRPVLANALKLSLLLPIVFKVPGVGTSEKTCMRSPIDTVEVWATMKLPTDADLAGTPVGLTIQRLTRYAQSGEPDEATSRDGRSAIERRIRDFVDRRCGAKEYEFRMPELVAFVAEKLPEAVGDSTSRVLRRMKDGGRVEYALIDRQTSSYRLDAAQPARTVTEGSQEWVPAAIESVRDALHACSSCPGGIFNAIGVVLFAAEARRELAIGKAIKTVGLAALGGVVDSRIRQLVSADTLQRHPSDDRIRAESAKRWLHDRCVPGF
jgi:hypothetical protein